MSDRTWHAHCETPCLEDRATDSNRVGNQSSDDDEGRDHFIVCEEYFERAAADIAENGMNDLP